MCVCLCEGTATVAECRSAVCVCVGVVERGVTKRREKREEEEERREEKIFRCGHNNWANKITALGFSQRGK